MTISEAQPPIAATARVKERLPEKPTPEDAERWLRASGVTGGAVQAGEMVPQFELVSAAGSTVNLDALLDRGLAVITFSLGLASPRCRASLRALQRVLPEIEAAHGTLVAISPEEPAQSRAMAKADGLKFDLLTDRANHLGRLFGLAYQPPEPILVWFSLLGLTAEGELRSPTLVLPATYVVGTDGVAVSAFLDPHPAARVDPARVLEVLAACSAGAAAQPR